MNTALLMNRDYTLIIDKSGSMSTPDQVGGRSRWDAVQESAVALARKCEQLDPDGITLYLFSSRFKRFENVTSSKVTQIFQEYEPSGSTDLAGVLKDALDHYFQAKANGQTKDGETIIVITDGEPDDRRAVLKVIIEASRQVEKDEELAISVIQVGSDPTASQFLQILDNELQKSGAPFDICDTVTLDAMGDMTLSEFLLNAIND
jgi:uncharacterized protein with von Willebrand factor type A (vWA) domain